MKLINGDCLEKMKEMNENSIDTIITDPPYGLSFMGKKWDYDVPSIEVWKEALRVLKPGGTALIFAGSRTQHRMAVNVEDAGFILKDCIMWLYGSGFPKATDISKQLDKGKRDKIKVQGKVFTGSNNNINGESGEYETPSNEPATEEAKLWNGWKSHGLKPAYEPILVAQKPNDGTYANNALKWGVSGLNIDGGRIGTETRINRGMSKKQPDGAGTFRDDNWQPKDVENVATGRFPANIILDEVAGQMLDEQSGIKKTGKTYDYTGKKEYQVKGFVPDNKPNSPSNRGDSGGASRFFYCAKASKSERNAGLEHLEDKIGGGLQGTQDGSMLTGSGNVRNNIMKNNHPTVKPLKLMEYLCTLTKTPTGGKVLDPFMGSGTTGIACKNTGRDFVGIELNPEYFKIAEARIEAITNQSKEG